MPVNPGKGMNAEDTARMQRQEDLMTRQADLSEAQFVMTQKSQMQQQTMTALNAIAAGGDSVLKDIARSFKG